MGILEEFSSSLRPSSWYFFTFFIKEYSRNFALVVSLLFLIPNIPSSFGEDSTPTTKLFDEASDQVFKVGLAKSIDAELKGHGTGFVVSESGLVATAYHVIAGALDLTRNKKSRPNVYIVRKGARIKATIWAVDSKNDMAILKVPVRFPKVWPILSTEQKRGTNFYLLGYPGPADFSIVNGTLQSSEFSELIPSYQITAPTRGGMSGGPVLSSQGKVVGMILAGFQGNGEITLAGQSNSLTTLIDRAKDRTDAPDFDELTEEVQRGYLALQTQQKKLLETIFRKRSSFYGWLLPSTTKEKGDAFCGETDTELYLADIKVIPRRFCNFKMATNDDEVAFELEYSSIPVRKNQFKTADLSNKISNSDREWKGSRKKFGKFACDPDVHMEKNGTSYLVSICSRVSNSSLDVFHSVVRIASLDFGRIGIVARMSLMGFTKENTRSLASQFVNSLEVDREYEPEED